jgi:hypothetical protein
MFGFGRRVLHAKLQARAKVIYCYKWRLDTAKDIAFKGMICCPSESGLMVVYGRGQVGQDVKAKTARRETGRGGGRGFG